MADKVLICNIPEPAPSTYTWLRSLRYGTTTNTLSEAVVLDDTSPDFATKVADAQAAFPALNLYSGNPSTPPPPPPM